MLSRWADVDMRTAGIAVFEQREPRENSLRGDAVQAWEHASIAQHANIVERRFYGCEHVADVSVRFWPYRQLAFSVPRWPCERYGCS
jgi:hypothetical protein